MDNHPYLSTACYHELHESCRLQCKFCEATCVCPCHAKKEPLARGAAAGPDDDLVNALSVRHFQQEEHVHGNTPTNHE